MSKFVPDIKTQRWIIITPSRLSRPHDRELSVDLPKSCPFCPGHEEETPHEIYRVGGESGKSNWQVRVIPNKYPITDIHEVIIHTPDHDKDIMDMTDDELRILLETYKARYLFHKDSGQVIIFSNHGHPAGASLEHAHSQVVVMPKQINLDALAREPVMNVVEETSYFTTYCPDFSQWPYETWISPKKEGTVFGEITDYEVSELSALLVKTLKRLQKIAVKFNEEMKGVSHETVFSYNYYIHHSKNWFIRIIPRLIHRAGFELGTGLSVNVVDPTVAAVEMSQIEV